MNLMRTSVFVFLFAMAVLGLFSLSGTLAATPEVSDTEVYGKETLPNLGSGKALELNGTTVTGPVMTGKNVDGNDCHLGHVIGRRVRFSNCEIEQISATKAVILVDTTVEGRVNAGANSDFRGSTLLGDVMLREGAIIKNSVIKGKLTASSGTLLIEASTIQDIKLRYRNTEIKSHVMISGGSVSKGPDGRTLIKVQGNGQAIFGGFELEGVAEGTQVKTPQGYVYLNGKRTSAEGPPTYGTFKSKYSDAPSVEGPQWTDGEVITLSETEEIPVDDLKGPIQFIDLDKGSVVTGTIEFGSQRGLVRLKNGSVFKGQVIGGVIKEIK